MYAGQLPIRRINPEDNPEIQQILTCADELRHSVAHPLLLYANADFTETVQRVHRLGPEGTGQYRTDSLLFGQRTDVIQRYCLVTKQKSANYRYKGLKKD
jgi:hypothetical protein